MISLTKSSTSRALTSVSLFTSSGNGVFCHEVIPPAASEIEPVAKFCVIAAPTGLEMVT